MDAIRLFEIHFSEPGDRDGFFEGQEVDGEVRLELIEDTVMDQLDIEFTGTARIRITQESLKKTKGCRLKSSSNSTALVSTCDEKYLNQKLTLYSRDNCESLNFIVPAGRHTYRFRVQLPYNLPSSVIADHGSIRYTATATLTRPWHPKEKTTKEFCVRTLVDLNQLPQSVRPVTSDSVEEQSLLCCVVGSIQANWHLERVAFVPGEVMQIMGQIHNRSRVKVKKSKAALIQHIRYFDPNETRYLHERRVLASLEKGEILPGASGFWREEVRIPDRIPPGGLKGCTLMDINYSLKVKVVPSGLLNNLESSTDIIIGSVAHGQTIRNYDGAATLQAHNEADQETETAMDMNYFV